MTETLLTRDQARAFLLGHHGLNRPRIEPGTEGIRAALATLRMIQLDPLDRIGTNADLVAQARLDGLRRGDVYQALLPGHAFEHFAKERCLLPASAYPHYRAFLKDRDWWRYGTHLEPPPAELVEEVWEEIRERGPLTAGELADRGRAEGPSWRFGSSRPKASSVALEILWYRCRVVVAGRASRGKLYDLPERALPEVTGLEPKEDFAGWALRERVEAAGLLPVTAGPQWGLLKDVRTGELPDQLVARGELERVSTEGFRRRYLAPAGFLDREQPEPDDRLRILAPLDPLLWDRKLVQHLFGFDYVWEVYKPAAKRRWGYYVCPLLHRGRLVGRFEGRRVDGDLVVENLWVEPGEKLNQRAWKRARERLEAFQDSG